MDKEINPTAEQVEFGVQLAVMAFRGANGMEIATAIAQREASLTAPVGSEEEKAALLRCESAAGNDDPFADSQVLAAGVLSRDARIRELEKDVEPSICDKLKAAESALAAKEAEVKALTDRVAEEKRVAAVYLAQGSDWAHQAAENLRLLCAEKDRADGLQNLWGEYVGRVQGLEASLSQLHQAGGDGVCLESCLACRALMSPLPILAARLAEERRPLVEALRFVAREVRRLIAEPHTDKAVETFISGWLDTEGDAILAKHSEDSHG